MNQFMYVTSPHCLSQIAFAECRQCACFMYFIAVNEVVVVVVVNNRNPHKKNYGEIK